MEIPSTRQNMKILCFCWNASGLKICETTSVERASKQRTGFRNIFNTKKSCVTPNFFEEVRFYIRETNPDLVCISTEEEDSKDSYFHSDFLRNHMADLNYVLLNINKADNVGAITSRSMNDVEQIATGKPSGSAVRISVYARNNISTTFKAEQKFYEQQTKKQATLSAVCQHDSKISGAAAVYVTHPEFGKFVFMATSLTISREELSMIEHVSYLDFRSVVKASNLTCLASLAIRFINNVSRDYQPDHVFLLGDLNYDVVVPGKTTKQVIDDIVRDPTVEHFAELFNYDELRQATKEFPLNGFKEGIKNAGPLFLPNWKLSRTRDNRCNPSFKDSRLTPDCFDSTVPGIGWHDRILYKDNSGSPYAIECTDYTRIDVGNMHKSTSAGVLGFYELIPTTRTML